MDPISPKFTDSRAKEGQSRDLCGGDIRSSLASPVNSTIPILQVLSTLPHTPWRPRLWHSRWHRSIHLLLLLPRSHLKLPLPLKPDALLNNDSFLDPWQVEQVTASQILFAHAAAVGSERTDAVAENQVEITRLVGEPSLDEGGGVAPGATRSRG